MVIELFDDVAPVAVMHFRARCSGAGAALLRASSPAASHSPPRHRLGGCPAAARHPTHLLPALLSLPVRWAPVGPACTQRGVPTRRLDLSSSPPPSAPGMLPPRFGGHRLGRLQMSQRRSGPPCPVTHLHSGASTPAALRRWPRACRGRQRLLQGHRAPQACERHGGLWGALLTVSPPAAGQGPQRVQRARRARLAPAQPRCVGGQHPGSACSREPRPCNRRAWPLRPPLHSRLPTPGQPLKPGPPPVPAGVPQVP